MSQLEVTLICEGEPQGRDQRWLGLVMSTVAECRTSRQAAFEVVPAGSKADLGATVRGMREPAQAFHQRVR